MAVRASYESIFRGKKDYAAALAAAKRVRDIDERDRGGSSLLGTAAYYGHADACAWVLDHGGTIDVRSRGDGRTPLLTALWSLSGGVNQDFILQAVRLLLDRGASVTAADAKGMTALHYAADCVEEAPGLVDELLGRGADPGARTAWGQTPLMRAAKRTHPAAVRALMVHGADVHARNEEGRDALSYALEFPYLDLRCRHVFDLLTCFVDVAEALNGDNDDLCRRLFVAAAYAGRVDVVERCLADGMGLGVHAGSRSVLDWAVWAENEAMFDLLVWHGADLNTMLTNVIGVGRADSIERCLRAGADPNAVDEAGERLALKYAGLGSREPVRALLKDHGADLDTLMRYAAGRAGSPEVVAWCLAEGADPNAPNRDGSTALHAAVSDNSAETVGILLSYGADPMARDHQGRVPTDLLRTGRLSMFDQMEREQIQQLLAAPATDKARLHG